jgi:hypothetical protein
MNTTKITFASHDTDPAISVNPRNAAIKAITSETIDKLSIVLVLL